MVGAEKHVLNRFKGWFSHKMLSVNSGVGETSQSSLPHSCADTTKETRWEDQSEEIEEYLKCLQASDIQECEEDGEEAWIISSEKQDKLEKSEADTVSVTLNSIRTLRKRIVEAKKIVEVKKMEVKDHVERSSKAEGLISLCNQKAKEIEDSLKEEKTKHAQLTEELERAIEQRAKLTEEVKERKGKLSSILELDDGLTTELNAKKQEQSRVEDRFEKAESARADLTAKIEKVRSQRDKLHRRIRKYKEQELIEDSFSCSFREFSADEVSEATENFSELMVIKTDTEGTTYKAKIGILTAAVEFKTELSMLSEEEFKAQVEWLCRIRQPHILAAIGACVDRRCVLFEYTPPGATLHDALFAPPRRAEEAPRLPWHHRIRIAAEVASAIGFLHSSRPAAIAHGLVRPSAVLFGPHLTVKLYGLLPRRPSDATASDNAAVGNLILQLLTGDEVVNIRKVKEALASGGDVTAIADRTAGEWPRDLAVEFATVGLVWTMTANMVRVLQDLKKRAKKRMDQERERGGSRREGHVEVPSVFICPIFQEVMKEPHVAADGFSYELEAIKEWLDGGHDTSPMTNLRLRNKRLTPNHALRSLINNWQQNQTDHY